MASRELNGVFNAATGSAGADAFAIYTGLREKILERDVDIARPRLGLDFVLLLRRQLVVRSAAALPEAAIVERKNADSGGGETFAERVPQFALLIALVEQQDSRAWF